MSMSDTASASATPDLVAELADAHERLERADDAVAEFGREDLEELADAYNRLTALLDRYEEQVVGDEGDFQTNVEFQGEIAELADDISEDMLLYETFAECDDYLQRKWFKTAHFEHVREQLEPVADLAGRVEEHEEALAAYRRKRREIEQEIRSLDERIRDLERLSRLGDADLSAPTERLREPITTYNEAVREAFDEFRREESARAVVEFLDAMEAYPLVDFRSPPAELREYIYEEPPGEETISTLVEYAGYSRSKLDHYVEDPDRLKHVIGGWQTYLTGLDAEPLTISWPPPEAAELRWRCRELTAAVNRIAPPVVEQLRTVAALPRETEYDRLRDSAQASAELTDDEREHIRSGDIERELDRARETREQLREALDSHPER
jgi:hypothetical protein